LVKAIESAADGAETAKCVKKLLIVGFNLLLKL
jgi:hypothetical protein